MMHTDWQRFLANFTRINTDSTKKGNQLFDLSDYAVLKIDGKDAKKLLQGQLTCDIEKITATQASLAAHCNPKGRIISLFYLALLQDAYHLIMPRSLLPITQQSLKKYALFYSVMLKDESDHLMVMGYMGTPLHAIKDVIQISVEPTRSILVSPLTTIKKWSDSMAHCSNMTSMNDWQMLNIRQRLPIIYAATSGKVLPHEINLHKLNAISFEKGCYTGQEIIARMHYRGKLKNHLYEATVHSQSIPLPGMALYAKQDLITQEVGLIIDACKEDDHYRILIVAEESHINNHLFFDLASPTRLIIQHE